MEKDFWSNKDIDRLKVYDELSPEEKAQTVRSKYNMRDGKDLHATSYDINFRELEINFIINNIKENINLGNQSMTPRILDIGCGNGYTDIRIAQEIKSEIVGIDFSEEMIEGADYLKEKFKDKLITMPIFKLEDVRKLNWYDNYFDFVVSERTVFNLPDRDTQYKAISEIHRVLKKGGIYIMLEGTADGLKRLNRIRSEFGLEPISDRNQTNVSSLKFEEEKLEDFLSQYFKIIKKQHFGMYYLISRVIHPLLAFPDKPKYDAKINEIATKIALKEPDYEKMGHVMGFVLEAM